MTVGTPAAWASGSAGVLVLYSCTEQFLELHEPHHVSPNLGFTKLLVFHLLQRFCLNATASKDDFDNF